MKNYTKIILFIIFINIHAYKIQSTPFFNRSKSKVIPVLPLNNISEKDDQNLDSQNNFRTEQSKNNNYWNRFFSNLCIKKTKIKPMNEIDYTYANKYLDRTEELDEKINKFIHHSQCYTLYKTNQQLTSNQNPLDQEALFQKQVYAKELARRKKELITLSENILEELKTLEDEGCASYTQISQMNFLKQIVENLKTKEQ